MKVYTLTIGLNDRTSKTLKFAPVEARAKLTKILLNHYNIYAFTMFDCYGCYKHDNGEIVQEPSIRIEIATDNNEDAKIKALCKTIKHKRMFNQESIMIETATKNIGFNVVK